MTDRSVLPVAVAYAHPGTVRAEFADSLFGLLARYRVQSRICLGSGPRIATTRNKLVRHFLDDTSAEWLWMVDSDMTFAPDILTKLLSTNRKVVGGLCFARNNDGTVYPTLYRRGDSGFLYRMDSYRKDRLIEVEGTGAACLLIHREVLEKIGANHPEPYRWFEDTHDRGREIGEDVEFCLRAKAAGYPVAVHTGIKLGHVKSFVVTEEHYVRT